ncbi:hypothetical protein [Pseudomonas sp. 6D_7.1_Bac1]|uniref:hypothetical protein n=1 Tax=Pseudomonas sp. 6D_7.1_Bac1 TaxID=2971615 RepID=UPI0021C8F506|nr:hypothetical protein [Pseudomonas sp. 6D_7.1_Bac1]MCU1750082.1 hypothetical protein [Pseudomonas sp. 6D_7.1_Bac1]
MTTYQERFAEACKTTEFTNHEQMIGGYIVWDVQHIRDGQKVVIDGPFFTEDEARVSADLLRGTFRGARAHQAIHCSAWNPSPQREKAIRDDAMASRMILAMQLRVDVPTNSATGALE